MPRQGKRQLNVFLSEESFEAWRRFADAQGVTVTGLIEAMGLVLGQERTSLPPTLREVVKLARQVDVERRRK